MVGNIGNTLGAAVTGNIPGTGAGATAGVAGRDFASFVRDAAESAIGDLRAGEEMSIKGITGEAELTDVVQAVNGADLTLRSVVGMRDRMVQAYQEIIRMPI